MTETIRPWKIVLTLDAEVFRASVKRLPTNQREFEQWAYLVEKGLLNGHIDWSILYECAKDCFEQDRQFFTLAERKKSCSCEVLGRLSVEHRQCAVSGLQGYAACLANVCSKDQPRHGTKIVPQSNEFAANTKHGSAA